VLRFSLRTTANQVPNEWIALAPDGSAMVSSHTDDNGTWRLWIQRWSDFSTTAIPGVERQVNDPVISPDGTEVAFFENGLLKVAPLAGGLIRTLSEDAGCCGRWGQDGFFYYSSGGSGNIRRVPVDGGPSEDVTEVATDGGIHAYFELVAGGDVGVFTVFAASPRIDAIRLSTGERRTVTAGARSYLTSSGHLVFATPEGRLLAAPFDADAMTLSGTAVPLVEGVTIRNQDAAYSIAGNGSLLYWRGPVSSARAEFVWVTRDGTATPVEAGWSFDAGAAVYGWRLSPDGSRLAFRDLSGQDGGEIWVKDLDAGPLSRLTFDVGADWSPEWSPDGLSVLFTSNRGPQAQASRDIWMRRADGTGEAQLVLDYERPIVQFDLSADGEWVVTRVGADSSADIFAQRLGVDTVPRPMLASPDFDEVAPALSPDGRWLAYASNETGVFQVYVRPFPNIDEGRWQVSSGELSSAPRWSRDGRELFYGTVGGRVLVARVSTTSGFRVVGTELLFTMQGLGEAANSGWYDVAPDGQRFIFARSLIIDGRDDAPELILVQNFLEELKARVRN